MGARAGFRSSFPASDTSQRVTQRRIHLLHTGGTLGMTEVGGRLEPGPVLAQLLADVPEPSRLAQVDVEILMNVDSADMVPSHWDRIASALAAWMGEYGRF